LTAADVESYLDRGGQGHTSGSGFTPFTPIPAPPPFADGDLIALKSEEKGMLATVIWHRDTAAAGYIETNYDASVWEGYAESFKQIHGLLLNPVLPLMAWRLMRLAIATPRLNATIVGNKRLEYRHVNLGFTVQVGDVLYLSVLRESSKLDESGFVNALVELQRRAASHKLTQDETQGATIGFSSMARWKVSRHIPILSPNTAIMVAHTVGADGVGILGATYDHRVVHGGAVAAMLRGLSKPD
jgi:pyruvate dehydrogenase E2 component (dihydrolipoamide acetyltransferase)